MEFKPTKKGLLSAEFKDRFGALCAILESSFVDEDCIWFGVQVDPQGRDVLNGCMHLSRDAVHQLLPVLRHFVRTGRLGVDDPKEQFTLGTPVVGVHPVNQGVRGRVVAVNSVHFTVQHDLEPGVEGQEHTAWEAAHLFWETVEIVPEPTVRRLERILDDE